MIEHVTRAIIEKIPHARLTWWLEGRTWFFRVKVTEDDLDSEQELPVFEFGTLPHSLESTFFVQPEDEHLRRAQAEEMAQLIHCDYLAAKRKHVYGDQGDIVLSFYAIYDHPKDYPDDWIIRRWDVVDGNPKPQPQGRAIVCESAEAARQRIQELRPGAILITIDDPDPAIYEVWS